MFTFTEVGNPGNTRQFDLCLEGIPPQQIAVTDQPWSHDLAQPQASPLSGPNFVVVGPTHHTGPHPNSDPVEEPGEPNGVPMSTAWGLIALFLLFLTVVTFVVVRRRWQQA